MELVLNALKTIRIHVLRDEYMLHKKIKEALDSAGIGYIQEYKLSSGNRVDFLTHDGIAIEAKKGKPNAKQVLNQLQRYTVHDAVKGIVLVIERYQDVPAEVNGKPCVSVGLNKLWGLACK